MSSKTTCAFVCEILNKRLRSQGRNLKICRGYPENVRNLQIVCLWPPCAFIIIDSFAKLCSINSGNFQNGWALTLSSYLLKKVFKTLSLMVVVCTSWQSNLYMTDWFHNCRSVPAMTDCLLKVVTPLYALFGLSFLLVLPFETENGITSYQKHLQT